MMTREDYIEKYGEEEGTRKWKKYEQHQRWKANHPDYYLIHRDEIREKVRRYQQENKELIKAKSKRYYEKNRAQILEKNREYRDVHLDEKRAYDREYGKEHRKTPMGRAHRLVGNYIKSDNEYGRECTITARWVVENIFSRSCIYCGESDWHELGCDRIDNSKGHVPDNVVCCCVKCNKKRSAKGFLEFALRRIGAKESDGLTIK